MLSAKTKADWGYSPSPYHRHQCHHRRGMHPIPFCTKPGVSKNTFMYTYMERMAASLPVWMLRTNLPSSWALCQPFLLSLQFLTIYTPHYCPHMQTYFMFYSSPSSCVHNGQKVEKSSELSTWPIFSITRNVLTSDNSSSFMFTFPCNCLGLDI